MGSFVIILINLSSFKDDDVVNLRKFEYFTIFKTFNLARKYDSTNDNRF